MQYDSIRRKIFFLSFLTASLFLFGSWGFFAHKHINRLAVFTLPPEMMTFYKRNIGYLTEAAVNADRRRFAIVDEAPRHYIDLDHFGDSALYTMPRYWKDAVAQYTEDTLKAYGILPWHIYRTYLQLRDAFMLHQPEKILKYSADLGHYLADAHVPLHTTENYNGQLTGQDGIHAFWESRLPELFTTQYSFFVGNAVYLSQPQLAAWDALTSAHVAVDSVLLLEQALSQRFGDKKYSFETKGRQTVRVYAMAYAQAYDQLLRGMVERQMRLSIKTIGSFWYTAWIDAGQPDLTVLIDYTPGEAELQQRQAELAEWKTRHYGARAHEEK